jgi:hypothetical protein
MQNTVIGIVDRRDQAEAIVTSLRTAGFDNSVISALLPDQEGTRDFAHEHHTKAPEGAVAGAGAGSNILLAVHSANRGAQKAAARILKDGGAHDVDTLNEEPVPRRTPQDEANARRL